MVSNSSQNNSQRFTLLHFRQRKKFQCYYLQKVTHNENFTPATIPAQIKTRDELQKTPRRTRILRREGIEETTIIKERRISKLKEQFKSLLSRYFKRQAVKHQADEVSEDAERLRTCNEPFLKKWNVRNIQ